MKKVADVLMYVVAAGLVTVCLAWYIAIVNTIYQFGLAWLDGFEKLTKGGQDEERM